MSLSPGPYSYNRFSGIPRGNTLGDSYRAIYEAKNAKPDFLDMDKDGNKKESFKKAVKDKETGKEQKECTCKEWVESLLDEGYDLSEYTWDDMERMFEEKGMHREVKTGKVVTKAKPGVTYYPNMPRQKSSVAIRKEKSMKEEVCQYLMDEGYTNNEVSAEVLYNHMSDEWLNSVVGNIEEALTGERKRRAREMSFSPYTRGKDKATLHNLGTRNDGPGTPGYEKKSTGGKGARYAGYGDQGAGNKARRRMGQEPLRGNTRKEQVDIYDIILSHLLDEGYAETPEAAESIMVNMSEEWRDSIVEADSLAAMQARREKRLAAQRKREGTTVTGRDLGHDYSLTADQQKKRREAEFKAGIGTKK